MQNRNRDALLGKHGNDVKQLHLTGRGAFVPLIRPGKMVKSPDADSWKTADPRSLLRRRRSHRITDPAHSGIRAMWMDALFPACTASSDRRAALS